MSPDDSIERVLFIAPRVHIYQIPPLTSNKGYSAATWTSTTNPQAKEIFTARLRILETSALTASTETTTAKETAGPEPKILTTILLEDASSGELFAAAPYLDENAVMSATDSARFFAIRVVGDAGMKAILGLGFEERSEAIDFGICLQECRKTMQSTTEAFSHRGQQSSRQNSGGSKKRDWSLKDGQTINVKIGAIGSRKDSASTTTASSPVSQALETFSLIPPPASAASIASSTGPVTEGQQAGQYNSSSYTSTQIQKPSKEEVAAAGFDDGEFGEFQ